MANAMDVEQIYTRYGPMVMRRCRQLLESEHEALDAMQEVFVRVLEYQDRLSDDAPSSLLYRMATNICLNRIRAGIRRSSSIQNHAIQVIAQLPDDFDVVEKRNFIERIFRSQKYSTRQIASMHWLEGMTYEEVALEVGMSVSGVRKRLSQLRATIERQGLNL